MKTFKLKLTSKTNLHIQTWGNQKLPKLFLIHAWLHSGTVFHWTCQYLQKYFYCIAPDLRGYGNSSHTQNTSGYFFYEHLLDIYQMLEKLAPQEKIKMMGHSMGGNIANLYAGVFPEKVSHIVNIEGFGPLPNQPEQAADRIGQWIALASNKKNIPEKHQEKTLNDFMARFKKNYPYLSSTQLKFLLQNLVTKKGKYFQLKYDPRHKWHSPYLIPYEQYQAITNKIQAKYLFVKASKLELPSLQATPEKIECKSTAISAASGRVKVDKCNNNFLKHRRISGACSRVLQKELSNRLAQLPPQTKIIELPDTGHMIPLEKPQKLAELILEFCQQG